MELARVLPFSRQKPCASMKNHGNFYNLARSPLFIGSRRKKTILRDFRVEYPGTWLQRPTPADVVIVLQS